MSSAEHLINAVDHVMIKVSSHLRSVLRVGWWDKHLCSQKGMPSLASIKL